MIGKQNPLYKRCVFLCSRRAMLENELLLQKFAVDFVPQNYTEDTLDEFNEFLNNIYDNDLFDIIMGIKKPSQYPQYNQKFLKDIEEYAFKNYRNKTVK